MPASSEILLSFVLPESARPPDEATVVAAFAARSAEMGAREGRALLQRLVL
jgi:hypothetical protein